MVETSVIFDQNLKETKQKSGEENLMCQPKEVNKKSNTQLEKILKLCAIPFIAY